MGDTDKLAANAAASAAKFRTTPEFKRACATWQFKRALEIISPAPKHRVNCEDDIVEALGRVEIFREIAARRTPAEQRKLLQKLAKTLHAAIDLADQLGPYDFWDLPIRFGPHFPSPIIEDLERCLNEVEAAGDYIGKNMMRKGAPRFNDARFVAIANAHSLLTDYSKAPGRSREGPWHELARVLFGNEDADLFDYMKGYLDYIKE